MAKTAVVLAPSNGDPSVAARKPSSALPASITAGEPNPRHGDCASKRKGRHYSAIVVHRLTAISALTCICSVSHMSSAVSVLCCVC